MREIASKLKSRRGASMVVTMVFFLLCVSVSAVILTAAHTNAGKVRSGRQAQEAYLAVSSAARLLRESVGGCVYTVTAYSVSSDCGGHAAGATERDIPSGQFGAALAFLCDSAVLPAECRMTFAGETRQVAATLTMDADYGITVLLDVADPGGERYPMALTFNASRQSYTRVSSETHEYTDAGGDAALCEVETVTDIWSVSWDAGTITKGGA